MARVGVGARVGVRVGVRVRVRRPSRLTVLERSDMASCG